MFRIFSLTGSGMYASEHLHSAFKYFTNAMKHGHLTDLQEVHLHVTVNQPQLNIPVRLGQVQVGVRLPSDTTSCLTR